MKNIVLLEEKINKLLKKTIVSYFYLVTCFVMLFVYAINQSKLNNGMVAMISITAALFSYNDLIEILYTAINRLKAKRENSENEKRSQSGLRKGALIITLGIVIPTGLLIYRYEFSKLLTVLLVVTAFVFITCLCLYALLIELVLKKDGLYYFFIIMHLLLNIICPILAILILICLFSPNNIIYKSIYMFICGNLDAIGRQYLNQYSTVAGLVLTLGIAQLKYAAESN